MSRADWAPNWRSELIRYLDQQEGKPFEFGTHDCLIMTAGAVQVLTGTDHAEPYRGRYTSLSGARKVVGKSFLKLVKSILAEIHPSEALDGDVIAKHEGREWIFGVLMGANFYVVRPDGLGILPRSVADKAFRVE